MNLIKYSAHSLNLSHHTWFYSLTKSDIMQVVKLCLNFRWILTPGLLCGSPGTAKLQSCSMSAAIPMPSSSS